MKRTALAGAIGAICAGLSSGVLAQEENQNDTDRDNQMTQQQNVQEQGQQRQNDETTDVTVEQEPTEVEVQQENPDITVEQSQPEVTIEQPEPNVTVEEAEPNVTVEQTGEPEVTVEEADDAQVNVNQDEEEQEQKQQREQQERDQVDQGNQGNQGNSLMSLQVSDLEGITVANQQGEDIGDAQHIAKHDDSGDLYAIVSVGGIWGLGATDIALPIQDMQLEDDQLVLNTDYGSDEIEDSANDYEENEYSEVDNDITLSEAQQQ